MQNNQTETEILEKISAVFDGEDLPAEKLRTPSAEEKQHLANWSLIGSALRHELPPKVDLSFADKVMAQVEHEQIELVEQPTIEKLPIRRRPSFIRKFGLAFAQMAVAASVAAVTVVGWQTYNAGSVPALSEPASTATMGPISGLSLASYQNDNHDVVINLNSLAQNQNATDRTMPNAELIRQMQQKELERINNYVRGYVLHSAAH